MDSFTSLKTINEDVEVVRVPWVGRSCKNSLAVFVMSSNDAITQKISEALKEVHNEGNFHWKLFVVELYKLEDFVRESDLSEKICIDFVILAMDTSNKSCLEWATTVLAQVDPDLKHRRLVLVNASRHPANAMAISAGDLIDFKNEVMLDMITANVFDADNATFLARRLLKYIEVSIGVKTGIPNLNI